jgi:hypothetical protein
MRPGYPTAFTEAATSQDCSPRQLAGRQSGAARYAPLLAPRGRAEALLQPHTRATAHGREKLSAAIAHSAARSNWATAALQAIGGGSIRLATPLKRARGGAWALVPRAAQAHETQSGPRPLPSSRVADCRRCMYVGNTARCILGVQGG